MKLLITKTLLLIVLTITTSYAIGCEKPAENPPVDQDKKVESTKEESPPVFTQVTPTSTTEVNKIFDAQTKPTGDEESKPNLPKDTNLASSLSNSKAQIDGRNQDGVVVEQVVTLTPTTLDLGTFSTSEKGTGSVTLTNTGEKPVTIERAKASCGCTTSDFQNGTVLQPGETTDVSVTMNGKGRARKMSKTVTFTIKDFPPIRLPVVAQTISYVTIDKDPITIEDDFGKATLTLTSVDNQPFVVTSILPSYCRRIIYRASDNTRTHVGLESVLGFGTDD